MFLRDRHVYAQFLTELIASFIGTKYLENCAHNHIWKSLIRGMSVSDLFLHDDFS